MSELVHEYPVAPIGQFATVRSGAQLLPTAPVVQQ
jgi:hypothetical protein